MASINQSLPSDVLPYSPQNGDETHFVLTDVSQSVELGEWSHSISPDVTISQTILQGGKQQGTKVIKIADKNGLTIELSPSRGMGLLTVHSGDIRLGWDSPVKEWVNPAYINLESRNGIGWLDGFNEMMVRCGFEWSGHPVTDKDGYIYTLHGKAQNTPASFVEVVIDHKENKIVIRGLVRENTFKKCNFATMMELHYSLQTHKFIIKDVLTNHADYDHTYQIIYHSNFGQPILGQDSHVYLAASEISPFNEYAASGLSSWNSYLGPTKGFDEMVFNVVPRGEANTNKTVVALAKADESCGVALTFNVEQLPCLTLWKNTDTVQTGYVTGLEPGTCYAYNYLVERENGRLKNLPAHQSVTFELEYSVLTDNKQVQQVKQQIEEIQGKDEIKLVSTPIAYE